jgi:hypothetical protein
LREAINEGNEESKQQAEELKQQAAVSSAAMTTSDDHTSKKRSCDDSTPEPLLFSSDAVNAAKMVNLAAPIVATPSIPASTFPENLNKIKFASVDPTTNFASMSAEPLSLAEQLLDKHLVDFEDCKQFVIKNLSDGDI